MVTTGGGGEPCVEIIVTGPNEPFLADLARALIDARLAACGQITGGMRAVYRWEGAVEDEMQARLRLHTRASLVDAVAQVVTQRHRDDVPCLLALPILDGTDDYLGWVRGETDGPGEVDGVDVVDGAGSP